MSDKNTDQISRAITSGLLLAVGVITLSLLSVGVIHSTNQSFQAADAAIFSPSTIERVEHDLNTIQPAAGGEGFIQLYEENEEFTIQIEQLEQRFDFEIEPTLEGLPPQPVNE